MGTYRPKEQHLSSSHITVIVCLIEVTEPMRTGPTRYSGGLVAVHVRSSQNANWSSAKGRLRFGYLEGGPEKGPTCVQPCLPSTNEFLGVGKDGQP